MELVAEYIEIRKGVFKDYVRYEDRRAIDVMIHAHAESIIKTCRERVEKKWEKRRHNGDYEEFCSEVRYMANNDVHLIRLKKEYAGEDGSQLQHYVSRLPIRPMGRVMYEGNDAVILRVFLKGVLPLVLGVAVGSLLIYLMRM
ncbi:hypothetical protein GZH47_33655 (plasmid) [Paenibacillus rhizovicinus]|uniref:Uncharacterized protein n=1 Tax=Paenibacillus rhizovicinus TaxID=2704463 RepID=A0A6C0PB78_9BACL|nr:hypothetical protein [Paenibacillus rhizovicinus]QHW35840.1 hypothetical protein GZH47_33655 [Paenibacillus rhizovicinus]